MATEPIADRSITRGQPSAARRPLAALVRHRRRRPPPSPSRALLIALVPLVVLLLVLVIALGGLAGLGAVAGLSLYDRYSAGLPDVAALRSVVLPGTTRLYDRTGTHLLAMLYVEDRDYLSLERIPRLVIDATVAVEDRTFWTNPGVDPEAVVRAAVNNVEGGPLQGASTITEQVVKRFLVGDAPTIERKIREAILAERVNEAFSKSRILELYLNSVYYGEQAYGIAAAARRYFGRPLDTLSVAQVAILVGLPKAPVEDDPFLNPGPARARELAVLAGMRDEGVIAGRAYDAAVAAPLGLRRWVTPPLPVPWFSDRAIDEASAILGGRDRLAACGCRVITTLDWGLQRVAQKDLTSFVRTLPASTNVHNGALVAEDPRTGELLAYVGSVDQRDHSAKVRGEFDAAGLALRSPGSAWKAITYLSAIEAGHLSAASRLWDVSTQFAPGYRPADYFRNERGPITVRQAIRESRNIPAIRAMMAYGGPAAMAAMAARLGVSRPIPRADYGPALAIGTESVTLTDVVAAYSTIDALGSRSSQHRILRIEGPTGSIIYEARPGGRQVIDPRLPWTLIDILKDNADPHGSWLTGARASIGRPAAVKTGTEVDVRDTYAMGMIPSLVVGVWMGNADNSPLAPTFHSFTGPLVVWHTFILDAIRLERWKPADWPRPAGLVKARVCADRSMFGGHGSDQAGPDCPFGWSGEWVIPGFNDPATKRALDGPEFGTFLTDGQGNLEPAGCSFGVPVTGVLARAETPAWQTDLDAWVRAAESGGMYRWILPPAPGASCFLPPPQPPSPEPSPAPEPPGGGLPGSPGPSGPP